MKINGSEDDVKYVWLLWIGLLMCYKGIYKKERLREQKQIYKRYLSPDYRL